MLEVFPSFAIFTACIVWDTGKRYIELDIFEHERFIIVYEKEGIQREVDHGKIIEFLIVG